MEINTKLIKLENSGYRYVFSAIWIIYSLMNLNKSYQAYNKYIISNPDISTSYLKGVYLYLTIIVIMVISVMVFIYIDYTVKNKDRYLVVKDDTIFIPNSITSKVKKIKFEDIDNIGLEGLYQEKVKINMKSNEFIFAPRLYNVFDIDIKDIYNTLNELLVIKKSKIK